MTTPPAPVPTVAARLRQRVARLAELAATPLVPSDYVDLVDPLRSPTDLRARIVAISPETRDAVTLTLAPGRGWRPHVPGQYVRLGVDVDGVRQWRTYSLTSVPDRADGLLTVTVKAIPDGIVSGHLVRRARVGEVLQLDQAAGYFTLPTPLPGKVLFVTAGSGITPVMGMVRSLLDELDDVVLVHTAPTVDEVVFGGELRKLAAQGRLRLIERHTATDGRLGVGELAGLVPDLAERDTWACGPNGLLDALEEHWAREGFTDRLHTERFRPTVAATGEGGTVRFSRTGTTVESDGATALLDAGEAAGVLMPSGCRMGICFGCVVPLQEGAVRDLRSGDVTTAAPGDGVLIQTCISAAAAACDIDL
ncbi:ferredoxin reductase [Nitriliruptor alkaliphilus]|uniref:ferredoxin reductase n=1 Tax=Nitriliruptor alkaliphilus TaxID=427918 RepID=UPI0006969131|nr:ferredoxin reductase [Nitriliruptor alkaliphilus]